ncbi:MAG: OmpH family outer membrane protein [Flavobacteriaceae bacterium]|nr:OmpH family outer membrane protein [Flavobacteriaceae bacterium]
MKTKVLLLIIMTIASQFVTAQRGIRVAYIDTEYILENVEEYKETSTQLDEKVKQWKGEIELRLKDVDLMKETLNNERVLLTKELIEEREEDIKALEAEILDYQQKRFGHNGDLMIQKQKLIQPIQDQVFTAVREIAKARKYDFVFDKAADITMLYSNKKHDISDLVLKSINRTAKRNQAKNRKEAKEASEEEVVPKEVDEDKLERQRILDEKKAARQKAIEERRKQQEEIRAQKKKEFEERRKKLLEEREAKRNARNNSGSPKPPADGATEGEQNNEDGETDDGNDDDK